MSILKVDELQSRTSGNRITLPDVNYYPPYRNLIINGDMSIAQRGTSSSGQTTTGYYTIDRFRQTIGMGTWTLSQSTDVPSGQGFAYSQKLDCTTADASPSGTDRIMFQQYIEGQNLQQLKKGTSNAESLTLSFWVKSNKTGTYICELRDVDNSRHISKSYTISSADTWEKKTVTYDGDTTGAFDNDNNASLRLNFWLGTSSTFSSGTLATSWSSYADANRAVGQVNLADDTANEWLITGVQLEVGTSASDFEFLPYDVNLKRCERYFQKSYEVLTPVGTDTFTGMAIMRNYSAGDKTNNPFYTPFQTRMRATPTMTIYSKAGNSAKIVTGGGTLDNSTTERSVTGTVASQRGLFGIIAQVDASAFGQAHWTADAEL